MKMEQIKCSEMSAYKIQTPGNYPEESIQQALFCSGIYMNKNKNDFASVCLSYIMNEGDSNAY